MPLKYASEFVEIVADITYFRSVIDDDTRFETDFDDDIIAACAPLFLITFDH